MLEPRTRPPQNDPATDIHPDMPNYVGSEADMLMALAEGDADIEAGRTVPFDDVAVELRRNYAKA